MVFSIIQKDIKCDAKILMSRKISVALNYTKVELNLKFLIFLMHVKFSNIAVFLMANVVLVLLL